jgi:hypothetical protein
MYPSVMKALRAMCGESEGNIPFMYLDVRALVTVGIGHLLTLEDAKGRPFTKKADGSSVKIEEIEEEWKLVNSRKDLAAKGHKAFEEITKLQIASGEVREQMFRNDITSKEAVIKRDKDFKDYEGWPADAQIAILSMFFAMGNVGVFDKKKGEMTWKNFRAAVKAKNFDAAAAECFMKGAGLEKRNKANAISFKNAARVEEANSPDKTYATLGYTRSIVYWPQELHARDDGSADGGSSQSEPMSYAP